MAIPSNYIDKITKGNDSRMISIAADMVRVDNDNFDGADLNEVLDEVSQDISEAGKVKSVSVNGVNHTPNSSGVVDLGDVVTDVSGKADLVNQAILNPTQWPRVLLYSIDPTVSHKDAALGDIVITENTVTGKPRLSLLYGPRNEVILGEPVYGVIYIDKQTGNLYRWDQGWVPVGSQSDVQSDWNETDTSSKAYILNKPTLFSGNYNDLSNKPTIPDTSTLATKTELNGKQDVINDLSAIRSGAAAGATAAQPADIPAKVSDLTNDAGYTANQGTVTGISVNGGAAQQPTNGVVNLTVATGGDNDLVGLSDGTANDGAVVFTKRNGDTVTVDLNHVHPQYLKYELLADEAAYTALATKDSSTLYLIPAEEE